MLPQFADKHSTQYLEAVHLLRLDRAQESGLAQRILTKKSEDYPQRKSEDCMLNERKSEDYIQNQSRIDGFRDEFDYQFISSVLLYLLLLLPKIMD